MQFLAGYPTLADREVVAFCAGALAFGRVSSVKASISRVLELLGPHPAAFIREFDRARAGRRSRSFVHRWTRGPDIVAPAARPARTCCGSVGSIEAFFAAGLTPGAVDVEAAARNLLARVRAMWTCAGLRRACHRRAPACVHFFSRALGRQRLQAVESVPALDGAGATRWIRAAGRRCRRRSWSCRCDTHVIRLRTLSAPHAARARAGGWRRRSRRRCARSTRSIPCATISRSVISG